eukprot:100004-Chlamydomonas_euryale.AAC.3
MDPISGQAVEPSFPYHRCTDYRNSSLPYNLSPPVETSPGLYCMTFTYIGPSTAPSDCYSLLEQRVTHITIGVGGCRRAGSVSWRCLNVAALCDVVPSSRQQGRAHELKS